MGEAQAVSTAELASAKTMEREQFWNLPNTITVFRMAVVPVLMLLPFAQGKQGSEIFAWFYIIAAMSDILDGWLARRGQQVTRIGKMLDPLADKMLVSTALIMLMAVGRLEWWACWMAVVIVGRELAVTGLRGIASDHGRIMAANWLGKAKTLVQNIAVSALLFHYTTIGLPAHRIGVVLLGIATALTLWSGYRYFAEFFSTTVILPEAAGKGEEQ